MAAVFCGVPMSLSCPCVGGSCAGTATCVFSVYGYAPQREPPKPELLRRFVFLWYAPRDSNPEPADCSSQIIAPRAFLWTVFGMHSHAISTRDTSQLTCQGTLRYRGQAEGDHSGWLKPAEPFSITCRDSFVFAQHVKGFWAAGPVFIPARCCFYPSWPDRSE